MTHYDSFSNTTSDYQRRHRRGGIVGAVKALILFGLFAAAGYYGSSPWLNVEYPTITVTDKDTVSVSNKDGGSSIRRYVYTDQGTFLVQDSTLDGQFASADLYGALKIGNTYKVKARGIRVPFFSWFATIVEIESETRNGN